jgi:hypothetical protein
MTDNEMGTKNTQNSNTEMNYHDRKERRRELRRELRELRYDHPHCHGWFGGVLLILLGGLFLAGTIFSISFGQWWPVILIVIGALLLSRAFYWCH